MCGSKKICVSPAPVAGFTFLGYEHASCPLTASDYRRHHASCRTGTPCDTFLVFLGIEHGACSRREDPSGYTCVCLRSDYTKRCRDCLKVWGTAALTLDFILELAPVPHTSRESQNKKNRHNAVSVFCFLNSFLKSASMCRQH